VALAALLERLPDARRARRGPWAPRAGLNVHGPRSLPLRFTPGRRAAMEAGSDPTHRPGPSAVGCPVHARSRSAV
jgi:hypothetical protein